MHAQIRTTRPQLHHLGLLLSHRTAQSCCSLNSCTCSLIILYWIWEWPYFFSPGHAWAYVNYAELLSVVVGQSFICLSSSRDDIQCLRPHEGTGRPAGSLPTLSGGKHVLSPAVILSPVRRRNRPTSGKLAARQLTDSYTSSHWGEWTAESSKNLLQIVRLI